MSDLRWRIVSILWLIRIITLFWTFIDVIIDMISTFRPCTSWPSSVYYFGWYRASYICNISVLWYCFFMPPTKSWYIDSTTGYIRCQQHLINRHGRFCPCNIAHVGEGKSWFEISAALWSYQNTEKSMVVNPVRKSGVTLQKLFADNTDKHPAISVFKPVPNVIHCISLNGRHVIWVAHGICLRLGVFSPVSPRKEWILTKQSAVYISWVKRMHTNTVSEQKKHHNRDKYNTIINGYKTAYINPKIRDTWRCPDFT